MSKKDKKKRTDSMEDKKKNETRQSTMQNRMENMNGQKPKTISIVQAEMGSFVWMPICSIRRNVWRR